MTTLMLIGAALVVGLHGLIHLMGFVAYWPLAEIQELPYKATLLEGRWQLGEAGMKIFSVLWLVPAAGFVIAAAGLALHKERWQPLMVSMAVFSLMLCALDWQAARWGVVVNIAILVAMLVAPRVHI